MSLISDTPDLLNAIPRIREPVDVVRDNTSGRYLGLAPVRDQSAGLTPDMSLVASLPALYPEWLGDQNFLQAHHLRFSYVAGEMATGIATTTMVIAMAKAGMLGFFGSAGL